jgi:hypothetical protein
MTTGIAEPTPAPYVDPPAKNTFSRIAGVLFAPAETFRDIARKPDILVPMIILVILGFVVTAVIIPRMDFASAFREQMAQQGRQMSEADMERMEKMGSAFGKVMGWISPLLSILWWLAIAGILLLAHRLFGGEGNYKQALSTTLYSWIPYAIAGLVLAVVAFFRETIDASSMATLVKSNPGFLVDPKENAVAFAALSSLDIFTIWTLILLIIGFSTISKVSRAKSAAIVIPLWLVVVVIKIGFAAMGAAGAKAA